MVVIKRFFCVPSDLPLVIYQDFEFFSTIYFDPSMKTMLHVSIKGKLDNLPS